MIHTQSLNELWWRMLWNICHSICCERFVKDLMKYLSLNWCDAWCVESLLKVCDAWCVESLLKNHPQILMNVVKRMLWSECEIYSSYIFHNLSEYIEVFWLICYRSSFKNVCHYNCWMKVEWRVANETLCMYH